MNKLTMLPRPIELSASYIDGLEMIAGDLEDRAAALHRHAQFIRRHAAALRDAAALANRSRSNRKKTETRTIASARALRRV